MPDVNFINIKADELYRQIMEELENGEESSPILEMSGVSFFGDALAPVF